MNRHRQGKGCRLRPRLDLALQCWRFEGRIKTNRHSNAVPPHYWADRLRSDELTFPQRWKSWRVVHTLSSGSSDSDETGRATAERSRGCSVALQQHLSALSKSWLSVKAFLWRSHGGALENQITPYDSICADSGIDCSWRCV
jgi:hypothetical protein